jgi:uncharacterized protein YbjQ (UPF0145 family)
MAAKVTCPRCHADNALEYEKCWKCKAPISEEMRAAAIADEAAENEARRLANVSIEERRNDAEAAFMEGRISAIPTDLYGELAPKVILSTSPFIYGKEVADIAGVVSAECVFGMNLFKDFFMGMTDLFGGRSKTAQTALREARETCLTELRKEALAAGGNAVVSVDLDYSEISGQGKNMLFLVASGTAVRLKA